MFFFVVVFIHLGSREDFEEGRENPQTESWGMYIQKYTPKCIKDMSRNLIIFISIMVDELITSWILHTHFDCFYLWSIGGQMHFSYKANKLYVSEGQYRNRLQKTSKHQWHTCTWLCLMCQMCSYQILTSSAVFCYTGIHATWNVSVE